MRHGVVLALVVVLAGGVASAGLSSHSHTFTLQNTGAGVSDARLRFQIDTLAVPGEDYFIDNVSLTCGGAELVVNGDFGSGQAPWKFFTNAPAPKPTLAIVGGEAVISFGSDGSNTQLYQFGLVLPAAGVACTLTFDACSTGGPDDPGYGHNVIVKLAKHTSPYTNYGLVLNGAPPNPDPAADLASCNAGPQCGDGHVDTAAGEECDDGGTVDGDGCDANCLLELPPQGNPDRSPYAEAGSITISPPFVNNFIQFPTPPGFRYFIEQASVTCTTPSSTDVFTQAQLSVTKAITPTSTQGFGSPVVELERRGPSVFGGFIWTGTANIYLISDANPFQADGSGALFFNIFHTDTSVTASCFATLFGHTVDL